MKNKKKIFLAGHKGMVGSALYKKLKETSNIIITKSKSNLDLTNEKKVINLFKKHDFDQVYICAAKVGGILANKNNPVEFYTINQKIQLNIINSAFSSGVKNLIFLGSSCIYPSNLNNIKENKLLSGYLDQNNDAYALAKITGIKLCDFYMRKYPKKKLKYISLMPCNLFGPGDNFDEKNSHVLAAIIKKVYIAQKKQKKYITLWGNGKPKREFMHVNEVADACIYFMNLASNKFKKYFNKQSHINIGYEKDISITNLAKTISKIFEYSVKIKYDKSKPNGVFHKKLNTFEMKKLGFKPRRNFNKSLKDYINQIRNKKKLI